MCSTPEEFYELCKAGSILGTLQAGYTDFPFLTEASKKIFEREALLGVSITGWMNNPEVLFNPDVMKHGAEVVKQTNKRVAEIIGINQSARCTAVKPSGNASVLLGTASGIHGEHSEKYIRHVQMNREGEVAQLFETYFPEMVEKSVWSANGSDLVICFPVNTPEGSIYKKDLLGVKQLEYVKACQQNWIEYGTNEHLCTDPRLRHNVSNTITVDNWEEVTKYVYDNRKWFCGISFLAATGDKAYPQAPFTEVLDAEDILETYGCASMFASGMITRALDAFDNNLWNACSTALGYGEDLSVETHENAMKRDWVRSFKKFSSKWFDSNYQTTADMLKDVYNLHKWSKITSGIRNIDWTTELHEKRYTDADTLGAVACSGGTCEIVF
jgi:ribonucleoside-diphosphate reductase alpha chain